MLESHHIFLLDVLSMGEWGALKDLKNNNLRRLAGALPTSVPAPNPLKVSLKVLQYIDLLLTVLINTMTLSFNSTT